MPGCRLVRACVAGWGHVRRKTGKLGRVQTGHGDDLPSDGGKKWIQLKGGLPVQCIRDLAVQKREGDLVLATFGRGFYVLDDLTPLRQMASESKLAPQQSTPIRARRPLRILDAGAMRLRPRWD